MSKIQLPDEMEYENTGVYFSVKRDGNSYECELRYELWGPQREAVNSVWAADHDITNFRGGYGSGKSVVGARATHEVGIKVIGSSSLVMGQDFSKGDGTTYEVFFEELPGENTVPDDGDGDPENSPIVAGYNHNKKRLTYITGSTAHLGSADKWNRYAGAEFNFIWCDEVAHYGTTDLFKLNEMLVSRQRTAQGPNTTLWTTTGNGYNQYYQFSEVQETPGGDPVTSTINTIVADSRDNPYLNEKEKLTRQFESTSREAEALSGGFASPEGLVYDAFRLDTHVVGNGEAAERTDGVADRLYGYDYGFKNPRVLLEGVPLSTGQYVILDEYYESEETLEDLVDPRHREGWVYEHDKPRGTVYCDHDPEHIEKFTRAGFDAEAAKKNIDEGITEVQSVLEVDASFGEPGLLIAERCENLIKELQTYKQEHVGTSKATDHGVDSLRYLVMGDRYVEGENEKRTVRRSGTETRGRRTIRRR